MKDKLRITINSREDAEFLRRAVVFYSCAQLEDNYQAYHKAKASHPEKVDTIKAEEQRINELLARYENRLEALLDKFDVKAGKEIEA